MSSTTATCRSGEQPLRGGMLVLAAIMLASANFIAVLDMTIANVSVPNISGALGVSSSQGTWVITSYAVAEAIVVPLTGWIAGRFGAVRVFAFAMIAFGVFSALCGVSTTLEMLIVARICQGMAGGLLMPLSQTLLLRIFPKEKANAAMGLWAMTTLTAPVLGPILGGAICDTWSWPFIFFVNVPLAFLCAPVVWGLLRRYETGTVRLPIDVIGLILLVIFVGSLQLVLDLGKEHGWFESTLIQTLAVVAGAGFAIFVAWELTRRHPIVNLRVFRHRGFTLSVIVLSLAFGSMFAANVLTPLWLQTNMGYTSTWAGMATAWSGVLAVVAAPVVGMLLARTDPRRLIFFGLCWLAAITWLRAFVTNDMTYWQISIPLMLMGLGLPFFFVPLTAMSLGSVDEDETASAAGLQNFLRTISGAFGTSVVQTVWEDKTAYMHEEFAGVTDRQGEAMASLQASGMTHEQSLSYLNHMVEVEAVTVATNQVMAIVGLCFAISALVIWLAPKPRRAVDAAAAGH